MTSNEAKTQWTPWAEYTSNSFSRIGTADGYEELIYAARLRDGRPHLEFKTPEVKALVIAAPELAAIAQRLVDWETKYPSSQIFSEHAIQRIAKEIDAIANDARALLQRITQSSTVSEQVKV